MLLSILLLMPGLCLAQNSSLTKKNEVMTQALSKPDAVRFIDKFLVPARAISTFKERVRINRVFIRQLPGFIEDEAYEYTNERGDLTLLTIAVWENQAALEKAKAAVQAEYRKEGFDPARLMQELGISMERGVYRVAGFK